MAKCLILIIELLFGWASEEALKPTLVGPNAVAVVRRDWVCVMELDLIFLNCILRESLRYRCGQICVLN